jgi:Bacteriophage clamp loader A subunit
MSPFDYVNSINSKKYIWDESSNSEYTQFIINRSFSYFNDTIGLAEILNRRSVTNKMHYDFLYNSVSKGKRFSKWGKTNKDELIEKIQEAYKCNDVVAAQYLKLLNINDGMSHLLKVLDKGGRK